MDIEEKLKEIEIRYENYINSDMGNGYHNNDLNYEIYIILKNNKKFNFTFSKLIMIDYTRKFISFIKGGKYIKINFSEIYKIYPL